MTAIAKIDRRLFSLVLAVIWMILPGPSLRGQETVEEAIKVCATIPDLGWIARQVAGDRVSVTGFTKGPEDPHFLEAKPSFITALHKADLLILNGLELETGWLPVLLRGARNGRVLPGSSGYLDASRAITPLEIPTGPVDRSMGDVHPSGNPHYLLDPVNGLKVARLIRDKLSELRPADKQRFEAGFQTLRRKIGAALVGEKLAEKYDVEKLALLQERGALGEFLKQEGEEALLGGWLRTLLPHQGVRAVADHNLWPYFARRFGIEVRGFMEPKPGISPTTRHLQDLIRRMKGEDIRLIITSPYFNPRYARFLSENTGARVARLAHQVGALEGTDGYLDLIDHNVRRFQEALEAPKGPGP